MTGGLIRGGIEMWLMNVLRTIDRSRYQMDFLLVSRGSESFEDEFRALGSRVIPCRSPRQPRTFARDFTGVMRRYGPYDVVHTHNHHFGGFVLRLAAARRVPVRVAHSHYDTRAAEAGRRWPRRLYLHLMKRWIHRYATHGIAVSRDAAADLFGPDWAKDGRYRVLHCGLDFSPFANHEDADRLRVRASLGLPPDALVVGHVGHFFWAKNHSFLLSVAAEILRMEARARVLLVGDGPLMAEARAKAGALGIADRVVFAGARSDVPALMRGAMDVFVFPSRHEGFGLALLEAQAVGLPCLVSDVITEEVNVVPALLRRLPLDGPPAVWASAVLRMAADRPVSPDAAFAAVMASDFTIEKSVERLLDVYESGPSRGPVEIPA